MTIPETFPSQPDNAIASYDYQDIEEGTGITIYYPMYGYDATSDEPLLSTKLLPTSRRGKVTTVLDNSSTSYATMLNETFPSQLFNTPRIVKGTAYAVIPMKFDPQVSDQIGAFKVTCTIYHSDGVTDTSIGQIVGPEVQSTPAGSSYPVIFVFPITMTQKNFKIGDFIKVTLLAEVRRVSGTSTTPHFSIGHDPLNRDGGNYASNRDLTPSVSDFEQTRCEIHIPFKLLT